MIIDVNKINFTPGGVKPTGSLSITANGKYDVTKVAEADVDVPSKEEQIKYYQVKNINDIQHLEITPDEGKVLSKAVVNTSVGDVVEDKSVAITENGITVINTNPGKLMSQVVALVQVGGGVAPYKNGNYDSEGLKAIGWTDEDIANLKANVPIYDWQSESTKVSEENKALYGVITANNIKNYKSDSNLKYLPSFDTSSVTDMYGMFDGCSALTSLPALNTSSVTNMGNMFTACSALTSLPTLDTSNVTNMGYMFYSGYSDISFCSIDELDMSSVTSASGMFAGSSSNFNTLTHFILKDGSSLNIAIGNLNNLTKLDYDSVKSILKAMSNTTSTTSRTQQFGSLKMTDQNGELQTLVDACTTKGWTITGLTIN